MPRGCEITTLAGETTTRSFPVTLSLVYISRLLLSFLLMLSAISTYSLCMLACSSMAAADRVSCKKIAFPGIVSLPWRGGEPCVPSLLRCSKSRAAWGERTTTPPEEETELSCTESWFEMHTHGERVVVCWCCPAHPSCSLLSCWSHSATDCCSCAVQSSSAGRPPPGGTHQRGGAHNALPCPHRPQQA